MSMNCKVRGSNAGEQVHLSFRTQHADPVKQYFREILYLLGDSRNKFPVLALLFLTSSFLDLAGLGLIGPYVAIIVNPDSIAEGRLRDLIEFLSLPFDPQLLLIWLGMILTGVFIVKAGTSIFINYTIIVFSNNQQVRLRSFLMQAYQNMPYEEYLKRNSAEYILTIQDYTSRFGAVLKTSLRAICDGIVGLAILIILALTSGPALGLLVFLLVMFMFLYDRFFRKKIQIFGKRANEAEVRMIQCIQEGIEGFKEIRILGKQHQFHSLVQTNALEYSHNQAKSELISSSPRYLLEILLVLFIVSLVGGSIMIGHNLDDLIPILGIFGFAALRLMPSANSISNSLVQLRYNRYAVSRLYADLLSLDKIYSGKEHTSAPLKGDNDFRVYTVRSVRFDYQDSNLPALINLTLEIHAGESIGLIGCSGSGKTTLVDVLLGLLQPQEGDLLYNGKPINESLDEWRSQVAYIPQQIFLIDNTLRHNIALGLRNNEIDDLKLKKALQQARLMQLVKQLPDGANTYIGERGIRLSGGQRQRVALARAFYHERSVLIMDEATSALDYETEREIVEEIKHFKGKKTMIVIAHRLTTVQNCDRIYELENGKIINTGSYKKLILNRSKSNETR